MEIKYAVIGRAKDDNYTYFPVSGSEVQTSYDGFDGK